MAYPLQITAVFSVFEAIVNSHTYLDKSNVYMCFRAVLMFSDSGDFNVIWIFLRTLARNLLEVARTIQIINRIFKVRIHY